MTKGTPHQLYVAGTTPWRPERSARRPRLGGRVRGPGPDRITVWTL